MDKLVALIKSDYATVRELEKKSFMLFKYAGGAFVVGLLLIFSMMFAFIGVPLMILGVVTFFASMLWMAKLSKRPHWSLFCPYCASKNHVFKTHSKFDCDICSRPIKVTDQGQPIPLEPMATRKEY